MMGRKRKFEDVLLPDGPNEHPLKLPKSSEEGEGKLEGNPVDETDDMYPTILPILSQSSATQKNPAQQNRSLRAHSGLCSRCSRINLDTLLTRPHKTRAGELATNLSPMSHWDTDSCHLCRLLYSTMNHFQASGRVPLRTFSSDRMEDRTWCSISTNLLKIESARKYLVSQPEGIAGPVKLIKESVDSFDIVKTWINLCQSQHTKICSIENPSSVSGLRLIDCVTMTIVPGEAHAYVALSYVWGESSDTSRDPKKLLENLPETIEDAITVTKRLGYRYIWIDRYCIDQKNEKETDDQVGKMDLIYQNAELTIIAAIGDDPSYGLPGVGQRKREPEYLTTCGKVGRHFLISADAWPKEVTTDTKWETRAWTYQEALLSRRRLVFAKQQMYFECYGMYCCESRDFPLESLHRKDMQGFKSVFCSEKRVGIFPKGVGTTSIEIIQRIEEYSNLNLTNSSDILKGMLGIFNSFQRSRLHIHNYAGVPIMPSMPGTNLRKPIERWTSSMGFLIGLFWDLKTRSERRQGFPSWSWTGWHGPVKWGLRSRAWPLISVDRGVELKVKLFDGRTLTLEAFQDLQSHASLYNQLSNTVYITAWIIEVNIIGCRRGRDKDEYKTRVKLEDGGYLDWTFESTSKIGLMPGELCKGIILGHAAEVFATETGPAVLVCANVGDTMERIGLNWIDQSNYERYDKDGVWEFRDTTPIFRISLEEPLGLVKSWEEVQLG